MSESIHNKLKRVRKPRVHITYDVETNGAEVKKELPFVVGVMGDYSGDNTDAKRPLKERKFVQIDRDNFNDAMGKINPKLGLQVENTLAGDGSKMAVDLDFKNMDDFSPEAVVSQVEPLQKLLDARNKLRDLLSKADRSEDLENVLEEILKNADEVASISSELNGSEEQGE
ncbi:type VI secretion system contractile sheath small subunit [Marinibactrum halimedae]|uniref:Type VI secretion protein n=1 Tax=Marinibactrum halimedae TaxID=1444977 RepID=A0AA37T5M1_9GAMM|nr:type VI secretion system contractile sheath small subunit [Marinibactrum halimedae]MCD9458359.1 type VI secretion system contractile sheath small subunit [Marinibactrum halimedae]GLS26056.1 type VI secretion protein [Marinibactrum halimedae]